MSSWGHFADGVLSFTDSDAMPGKTYAYVVYERETKGAGPRSNPVTLKTLQAVATPSGPEGAVAWS